MRKVSILKVEPINFTLRNNQEKEIIIKTFQKFLNSLDFPIQIVIATDTLNLDTYLSKLEERSDKLEQKDYSKILEDFKKHLQKMILSERLLNRSFYLVIPERENIVLEVGVCEELLKNMNLKFTKLKNEELMFTLSRFFNDLYEDGKEIKQEEYLYSSIAPQQLLNKPNELQFNDTFARTIAVKGYPRTVEEGFLDKIITLNGNFDISIHIEPYDIETMLVMLNKELQKQRGDLWSMENKGIINPSLEIKYQDTRKVLEELQKGNQKMFNVSLYITCKGKTIEELNLLSKKIESELNALLMIPTRPRYQQQALSRGNEVECKLVLQENKLRLIIELE